MTRCRYFERIVENNIMLSYFLHYKALPILCLITMAMFILVAQFCSHNQEKQLSRALLGLQDNVERCGSKAWLAYCRIGVKQRWYTTDVNMHICSMYTLPWWFAIDDTAKFLFDPILSNTKNNVPVPAPILLSVPVHAKWGTFVIADRKSVV